MSSDRTLKKEDYLWQRSLALIRWNLNGKKNNLDRPALVAPTWKHPDNCHKMPHKGLLLDYGIILSAFQTIFHTSGIPKLICKTCTTGHFALQCKEFALRIHQALTDLTLFLMQHNQDIIDTEENNFIIPSRRYISSGHHARYDGDPTIHHEKSRRKTLVEHKKHK